MADDIVTDAEIDAAVLRGFEEANARPRATGAHFDRATGSLIVQFANGSAFSVPARLLQGLESASDDEIADVAVEDGYGLHWERLDVDFSIPGVMAGIFGTAAFMAQRGGRSRSAAKATAARKNGKKGGRTKRRDGEAAKGGATMRRKAG